MQSSEPSIIETEDGSQTLVSSIFKERYHSIHGARTESEVVFINAGLLSKLHLDKIRILEMGFGTGLNALLSLKEAEKLQKNVTYVGYEKFPITTEDAAMMRYGNEMQLSTTFQDMHTLPWNTTHQLSQYFRFEKRLQDIGELEDNNEYDIIYFDAFAPAAQEELWSVSVFEKMCNALSEDGILVTYCAKGQVKRNMKAAGFTIEPLPGPPGKREMTRARKLSV